MSTISALLYLYTTATTFIRYEILMLNPYCIMNYLRHFMHKFENHVARLSGKKDIDKLFLMYREIELLVNFFNWFHGRTLIVSCVLDSSSAFIISLYPVLGLYKEIPVVAIVNCGVLVLTAIAALQDFDGGLKVGCLKFQKFLKCACSKSKYQRRQIKSCRVLRIYVGSTNFYDDITPLNLGAFCVQNTVTL